MSHRARSLEKLQLNTGVHGDLIRSCFFQTIARRERIFFWKMFFLPTCPMFLMTSSVLASLIGLSKPATPILGVNPTSVVNTLTPTIAVLKSSFGGSSMFYRVIQHVVFKVVLTSKQMLRFSIGTAYSKMEFLF